MVNISIDVTDLGGEARPGDKVVLWKPAAAGSSSHAGRVISTAPVDVFLTNGKASVPDVEPGEMRVLLQCRGVESQGPIDVTVPDGNGTVTLRSLIESQFEYAPPIVSAVQEAAASASASEEAAIQAQIRSEAAADRADAKVDDAINNGANLVRAEVKQDADRAVSARQAATQSESNAKASENAAASSASNAKTSETNAKQSEDNAGDYAAVATTAATEAVDAMESASDAASSIGDSVNAAAGHADRAEQYESGAAAYAQNASDAADRVGTAEQVGTWAQQAQDAADRIGTAETVEDWVDSARDSASAAAQSETKAKEYRDAALSAASSAADELRGDLINIAGEASSHATESSRSAARAKTSETNAATHEANSLSAAERAEFAAEETIQQVDGDFATRNYVDAAKWERGNVPASYTLENLTEGSWGVASGTVARNLGIPEAVTGSVVITRINHVNGKAATFISSTQTTEHPRVWTNSTNNAGVWGQWQESAGHNYVDSLNWNKLEADNADYALTPGAYYTAASTQGLPDEAITVHGTLEVLRSRTQLTQRFTTWGINPEVWIRSRRVESEFYPWRLLSRPDDVISRPSASAPTQGMKLVPLALTLGLGNSSGAPSAATYRIIGEWGAQVTRWRLCMTTRNPRYNTNASSATVQRITVAQHAGNGATTGTNTNVVTSNATIPGDGTVWSSGWQSSPLEANTEYAFGVQYSGGSAPMLSGHSYRLPDGTNPDSQSVTGTKTVGAPFDIWIEAETYAHTPIIAAIGDSTSVGAGATREVVDSWLGLYCREIGALPVHYAASGDSAYNWGRKIGGYQMTRWDGLAQPDAVIFALGNNDMNTTTDGLTMAQRVEGLIPYVRKYIGTNLYAATVKPRVSLTPEEITTRTAYTDWLNDDGKQHFRDVFDFHTPVAIGDLLDPQYDSGDGTHLNDAGYSQLAAAVDGPVVAERLDALAAYIQGKGM